MVEGFYIYAGRMNVVAKALVVAVIIIINFGCASTEFKDRGGTAMEVVGDTLKEHVSPALPEEKGTAMTVAKAYDFERDTYKEKADTSSETLVESIEPVDTVSSYVEEIESPVADFIVGYRVQVFATKNLEKAKAVKEQAMQKTGLSAYIEYEDGFYKVRLGDFDTKSDAEKARMIIKKSYADCWVVQTTIVK